MRARLEICFAMIGLAGCSPAARTRFGAAVVPTPGSSNFPQPKLMVFGGEGNRTYLGCLNCSELSADSIKNEAGLHGSAQAPESIFNFHGQYGSPYAAYSPCNK